MNVSYNTIHKRRMALAESKAENVLDNCNLYLNRYRENHDRNTLINFFDECSKSTEAANKYSSILFEYAESASDLKQIIKDKIAPKLTNYTNIPNYISEQVQVNKICDRIWNNHLKITESNNILESFNILSSNEMALLDKICSRVDSFNLSSVGKVAIALEETNLLYEMNGIDYDKKNTTRDIVSYFMIRRNVNVDKIKEAADKYNNSLSDYTDYLRKEMDQIEIFKSVKIKDVNMMNVCIQDILSGSSNTAKFVLGLQKVLKLIEDIIIASEDNAFVNDMINECVPGIYDLFYKEYQEASDVKTGIGFIINILDSTIDKYSYIYEDINENIKNRFFALKEKLCDIRGQFKELNDIIYPEYNASVLDKVSEGVTVNTIYADPRKNPGYWLLPNTAKAMGIYDDVDTDSQGVEKAKPALKDKVEKIEKSVMDKIANRSKKEKFLGKLINIKRRLFKESESIFEYVNPETHRMDTLVTVYEVEDGVNSDIMNSLDEITKEINTYELNESGLMCYFINRGSILEFRVSTEIGVKLSESEIEESAKYISPLDTYLIDKLMTYFEFNLSPINYEDIDNLVHEDTDHIKEILELAQYCGIDSSLKNIISTDDLSYREKLMVESYEGIDVSDDTVLESISIMNLLFEADNNKDKEDKPKININFDKINLYLQGLKSKAKELTNKEREISRNIDSAVTQFTNSVKRALTADNREQIIKGSVIPSFSKCIKLAIVAAGAFGVATAAHVAIAPMVPVIVVFGALAGSKMLMASEQRALVDELEVEMEVLDREIANCESENKPKKLRALLTTKKELQRQYQRLKFGKKISKNFTTSSIGVPKRN